MVTDTIQEKASDVFHTLLNHREAIASVFGVLADIGVFGLILWVLGRRWRKRLIDQTSRTLDNSVRILAHVAPVSEDLPPEPCVFCAKRMQDILRGVEEQIAHRKVEGLVLCERTLQDYEDEWKML